MDSSRSSWRRRLPGIFVGVLLIALALNALRLLTGYGARDRAHAHLHLSVGDRISSELLTAARPKGAAPSWQRLLVIYSLPASNEGLRRLSFAGAIAARHASMGLAVVGIIQATPSRVEKLARDLQLPYPVVADEDGRVAEALKIESAEHMAVLFDSSYTVLFAATMFQPDDLRQLAERYVLDRIDYEPQRKLRPLAPGTQVGAFSLSSTSSPDVPVDLSRYHTWIVVTAKCASCSLMSNIGRIDRWLAASPHQKDRPLVVLSVKFTEAEVLAAVNGSAIAADVAHAREAIPGIEDPYSREGMFPHEVLIITTDPRGEVRQVAPLPAA
jgi:hypothetical protein